MAFSFPALSYIVALIGDAFLIFFSIFHVIAFDELKTDYKNPIDQCNSLNPVRRDGWPYKSIPDTFFPARSSGIYPPHILQCTVPVRRGVVLAVPEHALDCLPHLQVSLLVAQETIMLIFVIPFQVREPPSDEQARTVRSDEHNERGCPFQVPTRGLDQVGRVFAVVLLLFIRVTTIGIRYHHQDLHSIPHCLTE